MRPDLRKTETKLLRLEAAEKRAFTAAANIAGVPLATWMRERLRRAAVRELEDAGREIAFLRYSE